MIGRVGSRALAAILLSLQLRPQQIPALVTTFREGSGGRGAEGFTLDAGEAVDVHPRGLPDLRLRLPALSNGALDPPRALIGVVVVHHQEGVDQARHVKQDRKHQRYDGLEGFAS